MPDVEIIGQRIWPEACDDLCQQVAAIQRAFPLTRISGSLTMPKPVRVPMIDWARAVGGFAEPWVGRAFVGLGLFMYGGPSDNGEDSAVAANHAAALADAEAKAQAATGLGANSEGAKPPESKPASGATRPEGVPENWVEVPSRDGKGTKWVDPSNPKGGDYVRERGDGTLTQVKNGRALDSNGNTASGLSSPEAHFSRDQWKFKP